VTCATGGKVILDGQGGLLAGWTYHVIDPINLPNPVLEARVTRFSDSGTSAAAAAFYFLCSRRRRRDFNFGSGRAGRAGWLRR
jgi:hypothetical protein